MTEVTNDSGYADELRDHQFDGIQEFDNRLPNWWLWTFYGACIFSLFYWLHFHVLGTGALPMENFENEKAAWAEIQAASAIDTTELLAMSKDPTTVEEGKAIFTGAGTCFTCHGMDGSGMLGGAPALGPNLTDNNWIHGGSAASIYTTISKGVAEKGMPPWGPVLGAERISKVAAFVLSIRGTNVEGGKEPQGEPYSGD